MQIRVARPTRDLGRARAFYRDAVGLSILSSFDEHDGYSGVIFGLPDGAVQLELVLNDDVEPSPTDEDQLVIYLGSADAVAELAASIGSAGYDVKTASNPYWVREGAIAFVDPDGYWLILSPGSWS